MSTEPLDPTVKEYFDAQKDRATRFQNDGDALERKRQQDQKIQARVDTEFEEIYSILEKYTVQMKAHDPSPAAQISFRREGNSGATFQAGFYICTLMKACFNNRSDGSNPGMYLLFAGDRKLLYLGSLRGEYFSWTPKSHAPGVTQGSETTSHAIAQTVMFYATHPQMIDGIH